MIEVLIADDHAVVREGVKRIVDGAGDMCVSQEAANHDELLRRALAGRCDVVVMDLAMPGPPGLDVLGELRRRKPKLPVLILTMYPADQFAVRALRSGASGYLNKGDPPDELIKAIRTVMRGRRYVSGSVALTLASSLDPAVEKPPHEVLSDREFQILRMIAAGTSITEIARKLSLSVKTISTYHKRLLEKLGLQHDADLIRYALKHHIVE